MANLRKQELEEAVERFGNRLDNVQHSVEGKLEELRLSLPLWHIPDSPTLTGIDFQYYPWNLPNPLQVGDAEITQYKDLAGSLAPYLEIMRRKYIGLRCQAQTSIKFRSDYHKKMMLYYFEDGMDIDIEVKDKPVIHEHIKPTRAHPMQYYINYDLPIQCITLTKCSDTMLLAFCTE